MNRSQEAEQSVLGALLLDNAAQRALQRRLVDEADRALALAQGDGTPAEKLEAIVVGFLALEKAQQRRSPRRLHDILAAVLEKYQAQADGRDDSSLPTGIEPLDRLLAGGLRLGRVYGIAARPSVGKSSAVRTINLRDSGAIEQALDVAILLWTAQEGETSRLVGWTVAKNRKDPKGSFAMRWKPSTNSWLETDEPLRGPSRR